MDRGDITNELTLRTTMFDPDHSRTSAQSCLIFMLDSAIRTETHVPFLNWKYYEFRNASRGSMLNKHVQFTFFEARSKPSYAHLASLADL